MTERVVLAGVFLRPRAGSGRRGPDGAAAGKPSPETARGSTESTLRELRLLTETAGGAVVDVVTQRLERYHAGTLVGEGKVAEIADAVRRHRARTVVFDEDLSPAQQKALEEGVGAKIIDRTRLILDIFARRARTREGEAQVELAQLSYLLPRLTGRWRAYSQQVGGIGTRGPGERQLEYERRHIRRRIEHLKRGLGAIESQRAVQRQRRRAVPVPQVALIGYTNAGKSTLLNALTREGAARADDKLFSTLDPTTRRARLPGGGWAVFTDTVGFIQKLPTTLVAAFRSTLEEVALADCLVHVIDASHPDREAQRKTVGELLIELGAQGLPRVEALNKADLLDPAEARLLRGASHEGILLSALRREGLAGLLERIQEALAGRWVTGELVLAPGQAARAGEVYRCSQVLRQAGAGGSLKLLLRATPENWARLRALFPGA